MSWRDDSTATNVSLLSKWAYGVLRPIVRILRSAGVSQSLIVESVNRAGAQHDGDKPKGRLGSGSRYQSVLALGSVTGAWTRVPEWTDASGNARELSLRAEDPKGFSALVRSIDPRLDAAAVLKELQQTDVVRILGNATAVRLLRHSVVHASEDTFSVEPVLRDLQRFAETLEHNILHKGNGAPSRLQLTASRLSIDPAQFEDFARFATRNGHVFLDSADDRLNLFKAVTDGAGASYGVGVFVFFEEPASTDPDHPTPRDSTL
jgi:hypothetical protein